MRLMTIGMLAALLTLSGCDDDKVVSPRDVSPPAAPRGVSSVTGDQVVYLQWLENTEADVVGYRVYEAPCASGPGCPYALVGATTGTTFTVTGLVNGVTRYFAVAAYDDDGNESDLSYETIFDTPRPEGFDRFLNNYLDAPSTAGWDFSAYTSRAWDDSRTDMFFGTNGATYQMFVPDFQTDIQDAGWASSLDAVDYAPTSGWAPSGTVELIPGHCYIVWTRDDHYAKFRVTQIVPETSGTPARVVFDWAYQVDAGNRELRMRPVKGSQTGPRPIEWLKPNV
jgi:hypothetical protein